MPFQLLTFILSLWLKKICDFQIQYLDPFSLFTYKYLNPMTLHTIRIGSTVCIILLKI